MEKMEAYNILIQALRLVASSPDVQIASLPEFVIVPDEIALTYDYAYRLVEGLVRDNLISRDAFVMLKELDELFGRMSNNRSLWTLERLHNDSSWGKTRELALKIMKELGESYGRPDLSFISWTQQ